jgi:hypothetical protein
MSDPAAPNAEATPLAPMYMPMAAFPMVNRAAVNAEPTQTSLHDSGALGKAL